MLRLGPDKEQLEQDIATVAGDIGILNRKLAEMDKLAKERDKLRGRLAELMKTYLQGGDTSKTLFAFSGKTKDLLDALQSEIQKAQ